MAIRTAARLHGDDRVDDCAWLRDRTNADVIAYLEAENANTAKVMRQTEPLQKTLYDSTADCRACPDYCPAALEYPGPRTIRPGFLPV